MSAVNRVPCIMWKVFGANQVFTDVVDHSPGKRFFPSRPSGTDKRVIKVYYMKESVASVHTFTSDLFT